MARHFPVPHQLNAARGCVGKAGLESLWRPRGASAQNTNLSTAQSNGQPEKSPQGRRARRASMGGASAAPVPAIQPAPRARVDAPEVQDTEDPEPEVQDRGHAPEPEMDDTGIPEPDVPEPEVPQPEIPEPEVPEPKGPEPTPPRTA